MVRHTDGRYQMPLWKALAIVSFIALIGYKFATTESYVPEASASTTSTIQAVHDTEYCLQITETKGNRLGQHICADTMENLETSIQSFLSLTMAPKDAKTLTALQVLQGVCTDNDVTNPDCARHLLGMARQESIFGKRMTGDNGQSHGFFHIMSYHKVSKECAYDLECSADWTLKRMISKGYNENPDNAIRLHNGSLTNPKTLAYLKAVKSKMD